MQPDTINKVSIGRRIASVRTLRGFRQDEVADALGVSRFTVSKWERGVQLPHGDTLARLCLLLGCSSDYLLTLTDALHG